MTRRVVTSNRHLRLSVTNPSEVLNIQLTADPSIGDRLILPLYSDQAFTDRDSRRYYGTTSFMKNVKSVLPLSFSLKFDSLSASLGLTKDFFTSSTLLFLSLVQSYDENRQLSLVGQVRSMLEDYFFSECVQQVIIYDVRNFDGEIFFDCTIGSAVQKLEVCLCVVCYS